MPASRQERWLSRPCSIHIQIVDNVAGRGKYPSENHRGITTNAGFMRIERRFAQSKFDVRSGTESGYCAAKARKMAWLLEI
jgi:hypothetical protein